MFVNKQILLDIDITNTWKIKLLQRKINRDDLYCAQKLIFEKYLVIETISKISASVNISHLSNFFPDMYSLSIYLTINLNQIFLGKSNLNKVPMTHPQGSVSSSSFVCLAVTSYKPSSLPLINNI